MNLWESNSANKIYYDFTHGSAGYTTSFRERLHGWMDASLNENGIAVTESNAAVELLYGARYMSVVGDVLGTAGHSIYYAASSAQTDLFNPNVNVIFDVQGAWGPNWAQDPVVTSTLLRGGNFDYVTQSVVWNGNVPAGESASSYLATQSLPASFFRAARPVWFNTPWAAVPWPAIGPDVVGGNEDPAGHANKLPAQLCYENTVGKGLSFSAAGCYGG
jgi:hypothetical protein